MKEISLEKKYCSHCNKECKKLERGMCSRCYKAEYCSGVCVECGAYGVLTKGMCNKCYGKFKRPRDTCIFCRRKKIIHTRDENGNAVCDSCYIKHIKKREICSICGKSKIVQFREGPKPICSICYSKKYAPKKVCCVCGKKRTSAKNTEEGPICKKCYTLANKKKEKCAACGGVKVVCISNADGYFCQACYKKHLKHKEICSYCGKLKCIDYRRAGLLLCSPCADKKRKADDPAYSCLLLLRSRVRKAFRDYSKTGKTRSSDEYGIDYKSIVEHLGPKPAGDFHIDHILPLSAFDFDDHVQIRAAFAPENHQWLPAKDNLEKHNKFDVVELDIYLEGFLK